MEGRADSSEARMAGVGQGIAHLDQEFVSKKELMMETIIEMRNARRTKERGKVVVETPLTPSRTATKKGDENSNVFKGDAGRVRRLNLPIFTDEDLLGWAFKVKRYFRVNNANEEKLDVVVVSLEGKVLNWFYGWRQDNQVRLGGT